MLISLNKSYEVIVTLYTDYFNYAELQLTLFLYSVSVLPVLFFFSVSFIKILIILYPEYLIESFTKLYAHVLIICISDPLI